MTIYNKNIIKNSTSLQIHKLFVSNGEILKIQAICDGDFGLSLKGGLKLDKSEQIAVIKDSDLTVSNNISTSGIYTADVSGYLYIEIEVYEINDSPLDVYISMNKGA